LSRFLARRIAFAMLLVAAVSSGAFVLARIAPGDFATATAGAHASEESVNRVRARYGLDKSLAAHYAEWLAAAVRLDFGDSMLYDRPVRGLVAERAANTAVLALTSLLLATFIGLPLGIFAGSRQRGIAASAIRATSLLLLSLPPLLTSLLLVFIAARTGWFPISGMRSAATTAAPATLDLLHHLVVPSLAIGLPLAAVLERLQAQAMSETIAEPFVLATLARGVPRRRVIWRDALRAALRPVAGVYGLIIGTLLSGSFAVEVVTSWPGLGNLMLTALRARDVYLVAGCSAAGATFLAFGSLVSDLALALVDPRATTIAPPAASETEAA
jgi:peptide/nickel transport system permease protein